MTTTPKYQIAVWDSQARFIDREKAKLEHFLKQILLPSFITINAISDLKNTNADLLIAGAHHLEGPPFIQWMDGLSKTMAKENIWIPALIMGKQPFEDLVEVYEKAAASNWYFDIINPDHLESLPLRIANLLRIHDHIRELNRYDSEVKELRDKTKLLEQDVEKFKSAKRLWN